MVKVTPSMRSQIIEKHLYMYSLSQIAKEVGISKTTAYNIVQDWNSRVSFLDIDDIRIFLSQLRKSGITIEQCVQGYSTIQILKKLGVDEAETEEWLGEDEKIENDERSGNQSLDTDYDKETSIGLKPSISTNPSQNLPKHSKSSLNVTYQISYFIEYIYKYCKYHKMKPSIIIRWIDDLFDFYSIRGNESMDDNIYKGSTHMNNVNVNELSSQPSEKYDNEIPFISKVSSFIKDKKKSVMYLENKKHSISDNIVDLQKQIIEKESELHKVIEKEKKTFSYFKWYNNLSQYLLNRYGILLEQEINLFANALKDFKQYHFSVTKILSEYKVISSLRNERKKIQDELQQNTIKRDNLFHNITSLEDRSNYYQQTIKVYEELHKEELGLKELKKLNYLVRELALENGLDVRDAIKNFLKDVEDNYDDKLGFEKKVNELKAEMKKLEEQVPEYKSYLKLQGIVAPTLIHLNNSGVSPEDIIDMNHLVLEFKNSDFLSQPINKDNYHSNTKTNGRITKSQYWNLFTGKLKKLKNINLEISKQAVNLDTIMLQLKDQERRKHEMEEQFTKSISLLNFIHYQISNSIEIARQINEGTSRKMMTSLRFSPVFIIINNRKNGDDKGKHTP